MRRPTESRSWFAGSLSVRRTTGELRNRVGSLVRFGSQPFRLRTTEPPNQRPDGQNRRHGQSRSEAA